MVDGGAKGYQEAGGIEEAHWSGESKGQNGFVKAPLSAGAFSDCILYLKWSFMTP